MTPVLDSILRPSHRVLAAFVRPLLGVVLGVCGFASPGLAGPAVSVLPQSIVADPSEEIELLVVISPGAGAISNYDLVIEFDPSVVSFIEAVEGSLYVASGYSTWFAAASKGPGSLEVFDAIMQAGAAVEPPGELVRLRFETLNPGFTTIHLASVVVTDVDRYPIEAIEPQDGTITVADPTDDGPNQPSQAGWSMGHPHPNPSTVGTTVLLLNSAESEQSRPRMKVYDAYGRFVRSVDPTQTGMRIGFLWNGTDQGERRVPSGLYLLRLETPGGTQVRKVHLVR